MYLLEVLILQGFWCTQQVLDHVVGPQPGLTVLAEVQRTRSTVVVDVFAGPHQLKTIGNQVALRPVTGHRNRLRSDVRRVVALRLLCGKHQHHQTVIHVRREDRRRALRGKRREPINKRRLPVQRRQRRIGSLEPLNQVVAATNGLRGDVIDEPVGDIDLTGPAGALQVEDDLAAFGEHDHRQRIGTRSNDALGKVGIRRLLEVIPLTHHHRGPGSLNRIGQLLTEPNAVLIRAPHHRNIGKPIINDDVAKQRRLNVIRRCGPNVIRVELRRTERRTRARTRTHQHLGSVHLVPNRQRHTRRRRANDGVVVTGQILINRRRGDRRIRSRIDKIHRHQTRRNRVDLLETHQQRLLQRSDNRRQPTRLRQDRPNIQRNRLQRHHLFSRRRLRSRRRRGRRNRRRRRLGRCRRVVGGATCAGNERSRGTEDDQRPPATC